MSDEAQQQEQKPSAAEPHRFDYTPRRVTLIGRGYSRFVSVLKFSLPVAALAIIGVLAFRLSGGGLTAQKVADATPAAEKTTPGQIELIAPRYEGVDEKGRAYVVTAERAVRAVEAPDTVVFDNPAAEVELADKSHLSAKGKVGAFDRKLETLVFTSGVTLVHDGGYTVQLADLTIDLKRRGAQTSHPVHGEGPRGTLEAKGMTVSPGGDRIVFTGPALLTLRRPG